MEEDKLRIVKIIAAAVLLAAAFCIEKFCALSTWQLLLVYLVPYLTVGWETLKEGAEAVLEGEGLNEDFLMAVATLGALGIGFLPGAEAQFPEAVAVMLFFQIGEAFEDAAEDRSRRSIAALMDIRPDKVLVERETAAEAGQAAALSGQTATAALPVQEVPCEDVRPGEIIVVRPGDRIPMDGTVLEGSSSLDTSALTGESLPRSVAPDDAAVSGCINLSAVLRIRVDKPFAESTAARILSLVEEAAENKGRSENFITRFARIYTPVVVACAVLLALVPPLLSAAAVWSVWIYRALNFLVVSCPCALVISVPLTFFAGIGGASRKGILVKGSNWIEALACTDTVVFDKTGTLTQGVFEVTAVHPEKINERELLHIAAHVERASTHPIAQSLRNAYPDEADDCRISGIEEIAGRGAKAQVNGHTVCVGNSRMMEDAGAAWHDCHKTGTIVHVAMDGEYMGHIVISDRMKEDAAGAIAALKAIGVRKTVMLTGDAEAVGAEVAAEVGVDEWHAGLLPADKVRLVEEMLAARRGKIAGQDAATQGKAARGALAADADGRAARGALAADADGRAARGALAFVGDGINDAPVLARADVGIAMGALGSDAAIEAADVVLMDDKPSKIAVAVRGARRTVRIARQNTVFAIGVKLAVLVLASAGCASMMLAVFADVGVMVLAVLNATRALKVR